MPLYSTCPWNERLPSISLTWHHGSRTNLVATICILLCVVVLSHPTEFPKFYHVREDGTIVFHKKQNIVHKDDCIILNLDPDGREHPADDRSQDDENWCFGRGQNSLQLHFLYTSIHGAAIGNILIISGDGSRIPGENCHTSFRLFYKNSLTSEWVAPTYSTEYSQAGVVLDNGTECCIRIFNADTERLQRYYEHLVLPSEKWKLEVTLYKRPGDFVIYPILLLSEPAAESGELTYMKPILMSEIRIEADFSGIWFLKLGEREAKEVGQATSGDIQLLEDEHLLRISTVIDESFSGYTFTLIMTGVITKQCAVSYESTLGAKRLPMNCEETTITTWISYLSNEASSTSPSDKKSFDVTNYHFPTTEQPVKRIDIQFMLRFLVLPRNVYPNHEQLKVHCKLPIDMPQQQQEYPPIGTNSGDLPQTEEPLKEPTPSEEVHPTLPEGGSDPLETLQPEEMKEDLDDEDDLASREESPKEEPSRSTGSASPILTSEDEEEPPGLNTTNTHEEEPSKSQDSGTTLEVDDTDPLYKSSEPESTVTPLNAPGPSVAPSLYDIAGRPTIPATSLYDILYNLHESNYKPWSITPSFNGHGPVLAHEHILRDLNTRMPLPDEHKAPFKTQKHLDERTTCISIRSPTLTISNVEQISRSPYANTFATKNMQSISQPWHLPHAVATTPKNKSIMPSALPNDTYCIVGAALERFATRALPDSHTFDSTVSTDPGTIWTQQMLHTTEVCVSDADTSMLHVCIGRDPTRSACNRTGDASKTKTSPSNTGMFGMGCGAISLDLREVVSAWLTHDPPHPRDGHPMPPLSIMKAALAAAYEPSVVDAVYPDVLRVLPSECTSAIPHIGRTLLALSVIGAILHPAALTQMLLAVMTARIITQHPALHHTTAYVMWLTCPLSPNPPMSGSYFVQLGWCLLFPGSLALGLLLGTILIASRRGSLPGSPQRPMNYIWAQFVNSFLDYSYVVISYNAYRSLLDPTIPYTRAIGFPMVISILTALLPCVLLMWYVLYLDLPQNAHKRAHWYSIPSLGSEASWGTRWTSSVGMWVPPNAVLHNGIFCLEYREAHRRGKVMYMTLLNALCAVLGSMSSAQRPISLLLHTNKYVVTTRVLMGVGVLVYLGMNAWYVFARPHRWHWIDVVRVVTSMLRCLLLLCGIAAHPSHLISAISCTMHYTLHALMLILFLLSLLEGILLWLFSSGDVKSYSSGMDFDVCEEILYDFPDEMVPEMFGGKFVDFNCGNSCASSSSICSLEEDDCLLEHTGDDLELELVELEPVSNFQSSPPTPVIQAKKPKNPVALRSPYGPYKENPLDRIHLDELQ